MRTITKNLSSLDSILDGAITLQQLYIAKTLFNAHYFLAGGSPGFRPTLEVPFEDISAKVAGFCTATGLTEGNVGVTFIHRYNSINNSWYLCMQMCALTDTGTSETTAGVTRQKYTITPYPAYRYDLINGVVHANSSLSGTINYDADYFNNIYYKLTSTSTPQKLNDIDTGKNQFVQSITFPWLREIKKLFQHNGLIDVSGTISPGAILCFECCSFSNTLLPSGDANVAWPHTICMFAKDFAITKLGEGDAISVFLNNAADVGAMCPPRCNAYLMPPDLPLPTAAAFSILHSQLLAFEANLNAAPIA